MSTKSKEANQVFPLYIYDIDGNKTPNLNPQIVKKLEETTKSLLPEDILHYVYAILYSGKYRAKYVNFLKSGFPIIPFPKDSEQFVKLTKLGELLTQLHLFNSNKLNSLITTFPNSGSDTIEIEPKYDHGKVFINDQQYFGNIQESAWNFYIGGYQPAQRWLMDHKNLQLSDEDFLHYQKLIIVLVETEKIMHEIDKILEL